MSLVGTQLQSFSVEALQGFEFKKNHRRRPERQVVRGFLLPG